MSLLGGETFLPTEGEATRVSITRRAAGFFRFSRVTGVTENGNGFDVGFEVVAFTGGLGIVAPPTGTFGFTWLNSHGYSVCE